MRKTEQELLNKFDLVRAIEAYLPTTTTGLWRASKETLEAILRALGKAR